EYPFPFVNTGGLDLFLWRPVTSVATLENRPQRFDLTGALPLLEGSHNFTVNVTGIAPGSTWFFDADLALYTSPNVTGSAMIDYSPNITSEKPVTVDSVLEERAQASFNSEDVIEYSNGSSVPVSASRQQLFSANITRESSSSGASSWTNISQDERTVGATVLTGPSGTEYVNRTLSAPFQLDLGSNQVASSATYPLFVNLTTYFLNALQVWNESYSQRGPRASDDLASDLIDEMNRANGTWVAEYYIASSSASPVTIAYPSIISSNSRQFYSTLSTQGVGVTYSHLIAASDNDPTNENLAMSITLDTIDSPLALVGIISRSSADVGGLVTFLMEPIGGRAPFSYQWNELPTGCLASTAAYLTCRPTEAGTFLVEGTVQDNWGDSATENIGEILIVPGPTATPIPDTPA
ncbi:MAG: peptide-N4-asparagine amidase, partial [Thermoplasmata archaeon]